MRKRVFRHILLQLIIPLALCALTLNGCAILPFDTSLWSSSTVTPAYPLPPTATPFPMAEMTFHVALPVLLLPGETLVLKVLDEVTGLALNPTDYPMTSQDDLHYSATIPFAINSVVKYRYVRVSSLDILEDDWADRMVRYRMVYVTGQGEVQDIVSSWSDSPFSSVTGRVTGQVTDATTGAAIPNILVAAGGQQTLTDSAGAFILEGMLPGTHNLVAYALDGSYQTFQQGTRVEADLRTPVNLSLTPAALVNVTFIVIVPINTIPSAPIRLAGNLFQLGNTFGDLDGGISTVAARMPVLSPLPDGRYTLSLILPAGADIRYKYTLGDGFWNAEHHLDESFVLRQLIVPSGQTNIQVQDVVDTWQAGLSGPILFEVAVPSTTIIGDTISIQFNPLFGWTEPIPMWPLGNNQWVYQLFSPLNMLGEFEYRYCRNDQCGVADDVQTPNDRSGRRVSTSLTPQDLQDTVSGWTWLQSVESTLIDVSVVPRQPDYWAGIEFQADYDPTWQPRMTSAIQNVQALAANWLVLTPTWTVSHTEPLVFSPVPGSDPLWADTLETINRARAVNLNVTLFPIAKLPFNASDWWASTTHDTAWWNTWFDRYQAFSFYHADLATQAGVQALILGGDWLSPALPYTTLLNGGNSNLPVDAETRWIAILAGVRQRFAGKIYWATTYPGDLQSVPNFSRELDGFYLLWNAQLSTSINPSVQDLQNEARRLLEADIQPFQTSLQKPVIIAVAYPSVSSTASACLPEGQGICLPWYVLNQPNSITNLSVNLQAQMDVYQALLGAINTRQWVSGFVSRGYYPPVALQDQSASIHGKMAADAIWYWYHEMLSIPY